MPKYNAEKCYEALERCAYDDCQSCPFFETKKTGECISHIVLWAKAEIDRLRDGAGNWIPCERVLPPGNADVLCYMPKDNGICAIGRYADNDEAWFINSMGQSAMSSVSHWIRLPKPPDETSGDDPRCLINYSGFALEALDCAEAMQNFNKAITSLRALDKDALSNNTFRVSADVRALAKSHGVDFAKTVSKFEIMRSLLFGQTLRWDALAAQLKLFAYQLTLENDGADIEEDA
jgi:hypothetical protein